MYFFQVGREVANLSTFPVKSYTFTNKIRQRCCYTTTPPFEKSNDYEKRIIIFFRTATESNRRCNFVLSSHDCTNFIKPTFVYVRIGQNRIIVLNLILSLTLYGSESPLKS